MRDRYVGPSVMASAAVCADLRPDVKGMMTREGASASRPRYCAVRPGSASGCDRGYKEVILLQYRLDDMLVVVAEREPHVADAPCHRLSHAGIRPNLGESSFETSRPAFSKITQYVEAL